MVDENSPEPVVKCEPKEEFDTAAPDQHQSLWPPPPLSLSLSPPAAASTSAACSYDESSAESTHHQPIAFKSEQSEDMPPYEPTDLPLNALQQFYSQQNGFSVLPSPSHSQDAAFNVNKVCLDAQKLDYSGFRCDQCGKMFTAKWRLLSHQSVHTGARPFACGKCGARFSRRDSCVRHEKKACCKDYLLLIQERAQTMTQMSLNGL
ncbi:hypothetical protein WMY93_000629 [Mugilogobius chulae]|uniref:C2H2-type domain-containing protein n=1 Tax=Mugilogobius chulae TaxID=88201 RepID=A0AAW0PZV7_9GOBI